MAEDRKKKLVGDLKQPETAFAGNMSSKNNHIGNRAGDTAQYIGTLLVMGSWYPVIVIILSRQICL